MPAVTMEDGSEKRREFSTVLTDKEWKELKKDSARTYDALRHDFKTKTYTTPVYCARCDTSLFKGVKISGRRCKLCNLDFHERCAQALSFVCPARVVALGPKILGSDVVLEPRILEHAFPDLLGVIDYPSRQHSFSHKSYMQPTCCTFCRKMLVGITRQGFQCSSCHYNAHAKCLSKAKDNCVPMYEVQQIADNAHQFVNPEEMSRVSSSSSRQLGSPSRVSTATHDWADPVATPHGSKTSLLSRGTAGLLRRDLSRKASLPLIPPDWEPDLQDLVRTIFDMVDSVGEPVDYDTVAAMVCDHRDNERRLMMSRRDGLETIASSSTAM